LQLQEVEIKTKSATSESQNYYFNNCVVKITKNGIETMDWKKQTDLVWQSNIIDHNFTRIEPSFNINKENGDYKIITSIKDSAYFKVLINTSRMYWQKDADATEMDTNNFNITSSKLSGEENLLQMLHLINKIYTVGYMGHKFKEMQNSYFVLGMDFVNGKSSTESNGRSGKSFLQVTLRAILKNWKEKNGKLLRKENPQFIFDKVTENTDFIFWDDLTVNQDYESFFVLTTSGMEANHKGGEIHNIDYEDSPKNGATTNFAPKNITASLQGRLLDYYVSDYYHQKTDYNDYKITRKISDDFNGEFILNKFYAPEKWNYDYNFIFDCIQFYLGCNDKIVPPQDSMKYKSAQSKIGDALMQYWNEYFSKINDYSKPIERSVFYHDCKEELEAKAESKSVNKDRFLMYCAEVLKCSVKLDKHKNELKNSVEHYFLTKLEETDVATTETPTPEAIATPIKEAPETDLPF
jgi:hypothetical protein